MQNDEHKYDDMIDRPHPVSPTRKRMSAVERAAQFSPFAALTGYEAVVAESARRTDQRIELTEESKLALDERLRMLADAAGDGPTAAVTYFVPDERKEGGAYVTEKVTVKRLDPVARQVITTGNARIPIDEIIAIESAVFSEQE